MLELRQRQALWNWSFASAVGVLACGGTSSEPAPEAAAGGASGVGGAVAAIAGAPMGGETATDGAPEGGAPPDGSGGGGQGGDDQGGQGGDDQGGQGGTLGVCEGTRWIRDQAEYESLLAERCSVITGNLIITGIDVLSSEPGLETLSTIVGALDIQENTFSSLQALANVENVGSLVLSYNDMLTTLADLAALSSVNGELNISHNLLLEDLDGLEGITKVGGTLDIEFNSSLVSLEGLQNLTEVELGAYIQYNYSYPSLAGLGKLTTVGRSLVLDYVSSFEGLSIETVGLDLVLSGGPTLAGFENLVSVGGELRLSAPSLVSMSELTSLESVGSIMLWGLSLPSISGFENIMELPGYLEITNNPGLTSLNGFANLKSVGGTILISDNPALTSLTGLSQVSSAQSISVVSNGVLTSLEGLESPTDLEWLVVQLNPLLTSLTGVEGVVNLGHLTIADSAGLTSLSGLSNLETISDYLMIHRNPELTSLGPLSALASDAVAGDISILENPKLPQCAVDGFDATQVGAACDDCSGNDDLASCQ